MSFFNSEVCQMCVSDNRRTYPLSKLQSVLEELQYLQVMDVSGGICWECLRVIMKMHKFKRQVSRAQHILFNKSERTYLGSLSMVHKIECDFQFVYHPDPLVNTENPIKNELCYVKDEGHFTDELEYGLSQDCVSLNSKDTRLSVDDEEIKFNGNRSGLTDKKDEKCKGKILRIVKTKLNKAQSTDAEDEELREKFTTVMFSEDELVRNREEKRSQPNFKKIPYKCDSCVLGFTREETYSLHNEKKHYESIGPYICPVCLSRFPTPRAMESHRQRHYTCYRCRLCKYETLQRGSAVAHCGTKHAADRSGRIHCAECGFIAKSPEQLVEHKRTQHTLYCNECGEKFKGKHTLRTHKIRIHTANREYICDICGKTFKTKSRLESHMATHNAALAQKLSYCNVCNVQYKNIYVYRNHLKNSANHSERVYQCQDCKKRFASKVYWQKHCDFYHLKKSQFKCNICNKLLISDWRLKTHMQTRHGSNRTRNHACDVCGKKFYTVSTLRTHQLTHSTQRSYMCEQCGDTFKQRAALHTHTRALHAHRVPGP